MQDKYAGDVGDFGKFVLLRLLLQASGGGLRLGVNWYRVTRPERLNNDGRHVGYLNAQNPAAAGFRICDALVWSKLRTIVTTNARSVRALETSRLLPGETIFFPTPLPYGATTLTQRIAERDDWYSKSFRRLASADVIFLDPDNGIQTDSVLKTQTRSIKYALDDEVCGYARDHDLVIVYHHRDRSPKEKYLEKFRRVRNQLGYSTSLRLLRFNRFSVRDYAFFFKRGEARLVTRLFEIVTSDPFNAIFEEISL